MARYKSKSKHLEIEIGEKVEAERCPLKAGALYVFQIGSFLILGRWIPGWIIQPGRCISIAHAVVKVVGHVTRMIL